MSCFHQGASVLAEEPALWFSQLEGQFVLANITADSTKFYHVISNLDLKYVSEIKDIIINPPEDDTKYQKIKSELIRRFSATQEQKVRQLLALEELGDRKPSQFLRHLQSLAGPCVPDEFIRSLWASRLPSSIQAIIASQSDCNLERLAQLADNINEVIQQPQAQIHQLSMPSPSTTSPDISMEIKDLRQCIVDLTRQVAALTASSSLSHPRGRSSSRNRARRLHRSPSRSGVDPKICWYHRRFQDNATKCRPPCSYKGNEQGSR